MNGVALRSIQRRLLQLETSPRTYYKQVCDSSNFLQIGKLPKLLVHELPMSCKSNQLTSNLQSALNSGFLRGLASCMFAESPDFFSQCKRFYDFMIMIVIMQISEIGVKVLSYTFRLIHEIPQKKNLLLI